MNKKIIQNSGFTLIELLFSIALIGFMLTIMLTTFIGVFRFYNWSKTTRNTQVAARSTLDTITKEIRTGKIYSVTGSKMCVNRTDGLVINSLPVKSELIQLNGTRFEILYFSGDNCSVSGGSTLLQTDVVSSADVKFATPVSGSVFRLVKGPAPDTPTNPKPQSVIVSFRAVNGQPAADGKCAPSDNFCDISTFTTAVMER